QRRRCPGRPEEEGGELSQPLRIGDGGARDRVLWLALAEHGRVVLVVHLEGASADRLDRERPGRRVVAVRAQGPPEPLSQRRLRLWPQVGVWPALLGPRPVVENELAFAMEPISGPIGRHVAAVTPDGADLHPAHRLPYGLAALDRALGGDHPAVGRDDSL